MRGWEMELSERMSIKMQELFVSILLCIARLAGRCIKYCLDKLRGIASKK